MSIFDGSPKSLNADNVIMRYDRNWDWDTNLWGKLTDFVTWVQCKWLTSSVPWFSHWSERKDASWSQCPIVEVSARCSVHDEITPKWRILNHCQSDRALNLFPDNTLIRRSLKIINYVYPEEIIYWLMGTLVFPKEKNMRLLKIGLFMIVFQWSKNVAEMSVLSGQSTGTIVKS